MPTLDADSPPPVATRAWVAGVWALGALLFVQLGASALYWLPDLRASVLLQPTWEVGGLTLLVVAFSRYRKPPRWAERALTWALTALVTTTLLISLGQGFLKREFARDLVLALDLAYVPALLKMLWDGESIPRFVVYMTLLLAGLTLVVAAPYLGIRHLRRFAGVRPRRQVAVVAFAAAYLTVGGAIAGVHPPVSAEVASQLALVWNLDDPLAATARRMERESSTTGALALPADPALPPRIYLVIVESYGHVLYSGAPAHRGFAAFLAEKAAALGQAGYHARSKFLRAPVFGGGSWMADASLFCGVQVSNPKRYASLFQSDVRCLPKILKAAGYRTVWAAPSTVEFDDQHAGMYAFDASYFKRDFHYAGPRFGWSLMPDQLVLDFVHRKEIAQRPERPLFVTLVLTTSHIPWSSVPPLVDWDAIGDGALYHRVKAKEFDNHLVTGHEYEAGYLASIEYSLESIAGYLLRLPADDKSLVIVLGDHQPQHPVASRSRDPWWVPVHVISRDPSAVERFAGLGYDEGMVPQPPRGEPAGQEHLMAELLSAYGARTR